MTKELDDRKLDEIIAEKVFEWRWVQTSGNNKMRPFFLQKSEWSVYLPHAQKAVKSEYDIPERVPHYSTSIADAWAVLEAMRERGYIPTVNYHVDDSRWHCSLRFEPKLLAADYFHGYGTAPQAICEAALSAVGASGEDS